MAFWQAEHFELKDIKSETSEADPEPTSLCPSLPFCFLPLILSQSESQKPDFLFPKLSHRN